MAVLAFALAPYYIGQLASALPRRQPLATAPSAFTADQNVSLQASSETVVVAVDGMSCSACEISVKDALAQTPGVRAADVSYKRGNARIEFDPKRTNIDQIKRAIDSTGYKAK